MKARLGKAWIERNLSPERRWVLYFVAPFLFVVLVFTVLIRTSDPANVGYFQNASSFVVLSVNPYVVSSFPPPPNYFFFLLPQFWAYEAQWVVYDTTAVLKVYAAVATLLLGGLLYKITYRYTGSVSRSQAAVLAALGSPFLFFVSFVVVEQDVIGMVFAVAGLYFLIPSTTSERLSKTDLALGSGLLVYATFLYYFPVIVIWSLLVFSKTWQKATGFTVSVACWTVFFYLAYAFGGFWQFFTNLSGTLQPTNLVPVYSILNLATQGFNGPFTPLATELSFWMLVSCVACVLILPIALRFTERSVLLSVATTMALPFLLTKIYNMDEIVWVLPFATLLLATRIQDKHVRFWLLMSQCWLLPPFILLNMWVAPGYGAGTGVFYFTYLQFHDSTAIYTLFPQYFVLSKLLDLATFLSLSGMCIAMFWLSRTRPNPLLPKVSQLGPADTRTLEGDGERERDVDPARVGRSPSLWNPSRAGLRSGIRKLSRSLSFYAVLALVVLAAFATAPIGRTAQITYSGTDPFPLGLFSGNPIQNASLTYSFSGNEEVLQISNGTGPAGPFPVSFARNLSGQSLAATFDMSVPHLRNATFVDPVANFGSTTVVYVGQVVLPGDLVTINPSREENVTSYSASVPIARGQPIGLWNLAGSSMRQYVINLSDFQFDTLGLFFSPTAVTYAENFLFYDQLPNENQELFIRGSTLYFAVQVPGQPWVLYPESTPNGPYSWHSLLLNIQPTQLVFYLDGRVVHTTPLTTNPVMQLNVGVVLPSSFYYRSYAFTGIASSLLEFPSKQLSYSSAIDVGQANAIGGTNLSMVGEDSGNWSVSYSGRTLALEGNVGTYTGVSGTPLFSFGRYSTQSPELNVQILSLTLMSTGSNDILARVIVLSIGSPVALTVIGLDRSIPRWRRR